LEALNVTSLPLCVPPYFRFEGSVVGGVLEEREEEEERGGVVESGVGVEPIHRRSSIEGAYEMVQRSGPGGVRDEGGAWL